MSKKLFLLPLIVLIAGYGVICWQMSDRILEVNDKTKAEQVNTLNETWVMSYDEILMEMGSPEKFEVKSSDGIRLVGEYFENSDSVECAVVLVHGFTSGKTEMLKYADLLWDCGCDVVTYDHRAHGESDEANPTGGVKEKDDLVKVTDWVKEKTELKDNQIAWLGASWGAATALMAGADESEMAFIVADAPFQDWYSAIFERAVRDYGNMVNLFSGAVMTVVNIRTGVNYHDASPINAVKRVTEPVFLIHSRTDASTASSQSVNIAKNLNSKSTFIHTDWGADHCKDINVKPAEYRRLLYDFIRQNVGSFGRCGDIPL